MGRTVKDNSTFPQKAAIRRHALKLLGAPPVILEAYGGQGKLYRACYQHVPRGVVFETDGEKAELLAAQRPSWSVYENDVVEALAEGAGAHLPVNFLDTDAYGVVWDAINAFFGSRRPFADRMVVVANCGARIGLRKNVGYEWHSMKPALKHWPNDQLFACYLDVSRFLLTEATRVVGYTIADWDGYYCAHSGNMTHWYAVLKR